MNNAELKIKKLNREVKTPLYATDEAAGFDIYSIDSHILEPGKVKKIPTGIAMQIPQGFFVHLVSRSGLASKGIYEMAGIIDSDYRGEIHLLLFNTTEEPFNIEKGDRIAQGILLPVFKANFKEVEELNQTKRGSGGFHSTGKK